MIDDLGKLGLADVSRETLRRLEDYATLLRKWNKTINLVSPKTISNLWRRHFLDSAQIFPEIPQKARILVDFGSGAGFPGLVVSALAADLRPDLEVVCLEADQRKAAFLNTVVRELGLSARVFSWRIEDVPDLQADVVSARALAPLGTLLSFSDRHLKPEGRAIFLKGAGFLAELEDARKQWVFDIRTVPSKTDRNGAILIFGDIRRE